ncbi:TIGR00266 family protein [Sorangium sp. So ce1014]|uniref:TIGR00266 family protein n=1 Tax=Sorangium sp. So ce1014 TaxID=3133326 RepID=UPI003F645AEA
MQHRTKHEPSSSLLEVTLDPGEALLAEAGAMVARSPSLRTVVRLNAGRGAGLLGRLKAFVIALLRKLSGGETFFVNHIEAPEGGGWVWLAPPLSGRVRHVPLQGETMLFSAGSYLASAGDIDVRVRWGGLRAVLAREGVFFIEASGVGDLWITSYGAIEELVCDGSLLVDGGHLVGFDASLALELRSPGGGLMGLMVSGEGVVCEFTGRGRVLIQSRSADALVGWLAPLLPP